MNILDRIICKIKSGDVHDEPLKFEDFPALFRGADAYSLAQQKIFYRVLFFELLLFVVATLISMINLPWPSMGISQAVALFGALACAVYLYAAKPDRHWYSARAVAESVKTVTWRYVTKAEPFQTDDSSARAHFVKILNEIVNQNRDVAKRFSTDLHGIQVTPRMGELRQATSDNRKLVYIQGRVIDQQNWYARKNMMNSCLAKRSFILLISCIVLGGVFAICRIRFPQASVWPTDVFVGLASAALAWSQAKRFSELAASYSLAAYEISMIRAQSDEVLDDSALSKFVGDAENAFSREHTQWAARRDI
jgi:hypothetical protein